MTTKQMYDNGLRCRGRGFCWYCKDKDDCVEYVESPKPRRAIMFPAIYRHFKSELQLSDKPNDYLYATMFVSKPRTFPIDDADADGIMGVHLTEKDGVVFVLRLGDTWYHLEEDCSEDMVIYKSLYDNHIPYARPYKMFAGEVDHEKYPNVEQMYRFALVTY